MKQESTQATSVNALNRAKMYQLVLFPMNNGATNVYYILTMNFIAYYANGVLGLLLAFATTMVTLMRAWKGLNFNHGRYREWMVMYSWMRYPGIY